MKQYIVTEKQLQKLKDLLENDAFGSYWSEEVRELKWIVEDIEGTKLTHEDSEEDYPEMPALGKVAADEVFALLEGQR